MRPDKRSLIIGYGIIFSINIQIIISTFGIFLDKKKGHLTIF